MLRPGPPSADIYQVTFGRLWRAPLWAHLAALATILVLLLPVIGTDPSFTPDEGAAVIQATSLSEGRGWIVEHPFPEVDPGQELYPIRKWQRGANGFAPLAQHPVYALVLAGAHRVGGMAGMVLLSLAGTLAAAGLAAALAHRIDPAIARPTLWALGLASPLLFDGYLVMGHTLAAAAAAAAVLSAVVGVERRRARWVLAVAPCVAVTMLLRNEGLFLAGALAGAAALIAFVERRDRPRARTAGAVAVSSAVAGGLAFLLDRLWLDHIVGDGLPGLAAPLSRGSSNLLADRAVGFVITWLRPIQLGSSLVVISLLVMLTAVVFGAVRARRGGAGEDDKGTAVAVAGGVAALASVVALVADPANVVPGLLVAFPLAAAGMALLSRRTFVTRPAILAGATFGLFALAVIAIQYRTGGTGEWGGRYFALGLPVVVPVLVLALRDQGRRLAPLARRAAAISLAVCCGSLTTMAVVAHRSANDESSRLASWVAAGTARVGPAGDGGSPVVVSTDEVLPRLAWAAFDGRRWLVAAPFQVESLVGRLRAQGVERFAVITADPVGVRPLLAGADVVDVDSDPDGQGLSILLVSPARMPAVSEVLP